MASSISIMSLLIFIILSTFYHFGEAKTIVVGGSLDAWKVPESNNNETLNHWAATVRFHVGDTLVFKYDSKKDSVLQVTKEKYESCNTEKPLQENKDGNTKVKLDVSGPYFFISGTPTNCAHGEKLSIVVLSPNHHPIPMPGPGAATPTLPPNPSSSKMAPAPAPSGSSSVSPNTIFWLSGLLAFIFLAFA